VRIEFFPRLQLPEAEIPIIPRGEDAGAGFPAPARSRDSDHRCRRRGFVRGTGFAQRYGDQVPDDERDDRQSEQLGPRDVDKPGELRETGDAPELMGASEVDHCGDHQAGQGLTSNEAGSREYAGVLDAGLLGRVEARFSLILSTTPRITLPTKIANVVSSGRYMPTENSIGLRTLMRMSEMPMAMPTSTSGHAISPPTIPCDSAAMRPA